MKIKLLTRLFMVLFVFTSCKTGKYSTTEKIYKDKAKSFSKLYKNTPASDQLDKIRTLDKEWVASVNFGTRKPNYVMIHHTAQNSLDQTIRTFHSERVGASSHYVIGRDGKIVQMLNELFRGHHAGAGKWGNDTDLNSSSIGIELDNNGTTDPWSDAQINALIELLKHLKTTYKIPQSNFIGHMDFAPSRKIDPARFPWKKLADLGFGFWYEDSLEDPPSNFDVRIALRVIGYDIQNLDSAIKAFKAHYIQKDTNSAQLTEYDLKIIYSIFKKFI